MLTLKKICNVSWNFIKLHAVLLLYYSQIKINQCYFLNTGATKDKQATRRATVMNAKPTTERVQAAATQRVTRRCTTGRRCRWAPGVATATRSLAKRS